MLIQPVPIYQHAKQGNRNSNYNVLVLDQRFNGNSSVSFINTNVTRNGFYRDANVSAVAFDLNTKKNTYNTNGVFRYSYVNSFKDVEDKKGISTSLNFGETSGKIRYSIKWRCSRCLFIYRA